MAKKTADQEINNQDIFAYAVYRLDGAGRFVDVEDIVEECFRLSPSRFGWRHKAFPSDRKGWAAAGDLDASHPEVMLKTPNGLGRQLTAEGVAWVRARLPQFEALGAGRTRAPKTRQPSYRLLTDVERHGWARSFLSGERSPPTKLEAADILKCAPDSPKAVWSQRAASLRSAAEKNERPDILELVNFIQEQNPEWFEEA